MSLQTARRTDELERELLRQGVGALAADRHRCADCHRTPLIGEHIYRYETEQIVCELCRPLRRRAPIGSETVRHSEYGHAVRLTARAA
ncbi:MAG TPA: hypothetical protein VGN69_05915 [Solirubrobacteraceae bacterium]|jgi:hypothetical protein|nr:hypothetical protein [Solirubrobacteraceae bacterium]